MSTGVTWTNERDEALRDAWTNTTVTAPEIAKAMGGFEHTADGGKNAVIGRARRLGLTRKDKDKAMTDTQRAAIVKAKESVHSRNSYLKKLAAENKSPREPKPEPAPKRVAANEGAAPWSFELPFSDLREFSTQQPNQCRYPDPEDDAGPNYLCCGAETMPGESYCGRCHKVCHDQTRTAAKLTEEQIETRRQQGRRAGYASIKKRGLVMARTLAATTSPILDFEAHV